MSLENMVIRIESYTLGIFVLLLKCRVKLRVCACSFQFFPNNSWPFMISRVVQTHFIVVLFSVKLYCRSRGRKNIIQRHCYCYRGYLEILKLQFNGTYTEICCDGMAQSVQRLATGWTVRGSNPCGREVSHTHPDRPWGPPSLIYNGHRVFPGGKATGASR